MSRRIFYRSASALLALLLALIMVIPVAAAAPSNDNFNFATVIDPGGLPFSDSVDTTEATTEPGEPLYWCYTIERTVWYAFTPSETMVMHLDTEGSTVSSSINIYYSNGPGFEGLGIVNCTGSYGGSYDFVAEGGRTYYFQASLFPGQSGTLQINLEQIPPPINDNFASATAISSLPFDEDANTASATVEAGEPSTCGYAGSMNTIWYSFTPTVTGSVTVNTSPFSFSPSIAVFTGNSLGNLVEVACENSTYVKTFLAQSNTTYFIQVGRQYPWQIGGPIHFHLEVTPPPVAGIYYSPSNPSVYSPIQFYDQSSDPGNSSFQSFSWDFGDGTTSTQQYPTHQYSADGDYTVQHSVTTVDGRTGSTSQVIQVRTHDVAVTRISAPISASVGQTRSITISVNNKRYNETVRVELYRSTPNGFELVGSYTQFVPVRPSNRSTSFTFNYTFTGSDASVGKVTFKAIAIITTASDAFPVDNELISSPPTKVVK